MILRRRLYPKIKIRSSPPYPRSGGASSVVRACVESCARRISWDPIGFHVPLCGLRSVSSDLRLSSLAMVAALVRWSFGALARWLHVYLLLQTLLRQKFSGSGDGGARTTACLRLAPVAVVVARWPSDLFVFFLQNGDTPASASYYAHS
jgi:hypothetical protein